MKKLLRFNIKLFIISVFLHAFISRGQTQFPPSPIPKPTAADYVLTLTGPTVATPMVYNLGTAPGCILGTGTIDSVNSINLTGCILPTAMLVAVNTPAPLPTIALVGSATFGGLKVGATVSEQIAQPLSWTVGTGSFFAVQVGASSGVTINGVTAFAGTSSFPMSKLCFTSGARSPICLFYLPNASGITSFTAMFNESNGSNVSFIATEHTGMSPTAAPVAPLLAADSGYFNAAGWVIGTLTAPYVVPAPSATSNTLLFAGSASSALSAGTWSATAGYTLDGSFGTQLAMMQEEQANAPAGNYIASGSYTLGYQYFDSYVIAFQ